MAWSMNVLIGADALWPNLEVIGPHHCVNLTLYSQYWKPPRYKNPNVQNVAWRFQSNSSRPSRTFCANASAALVFRPEVHTPVATGCLFAVSLYHLPREQNGASTRRPTSTIWLILSARRCARDVSIALRRQVRIGITGRPADRELDEPGWLVEPTSQMSCEPLCWSTLTARLAGCHADSSADCCAENTKQM